MCRSVGELLKYSLGGIPVSLVWFEGVSAEEARNEGQVGARAVGEVSEAADSSGVGSAGGQFGLVLFAGRDDCGVIGS